MRFDENIHFHFMSIMSEMVVMYYDHYHGVTVAASLQSTRQENPSTILVRSGTKGAFEAFCGTIRRYVVNPTTKDFYVTERREEVLITWLMMELEGEFGLDEAMAAEMISDFFADYYYRDIYTIQKTINDYFFPNGYYNKLKGNL